MATRLADGSIKLKDGRTIFGNTLIMGQDLAELVAFLSSPQGSGVQGPQGTNLGVQGPQGNQGFQGGPVNAWVQGGNSFGATGVFGTYDGNDINVIRGGTAVAVVTAGAIVPPVDNTNSLGTAGRRWGLMRAVTVATGDLALEDPETGASLTIREAKEAGEDPSKVYVVDKNTGKKFELLMKEITQ